MTNTVRTVITGTGSYLPPKKVLNKEYLDQTFFGADKKSIELSNDEIINRFSDITGIFERRHIDDNQVTSDIATIAAENALQSAGVDKETLDFIIVAHNFGDVDADNKRSDIVPGVASRVKHKLGIKNPFCLPIDVLFGCPGWLQGLIQAHLYLKSGEFKRGIVIGAETLSRVSDPFDRDSMIFADGAGAVIVEGEENPNPVGVIAYLTRADTLDSLNLLSMRNSNDPNGDPNEIFLKMDGRKVYQYALEHVPQAIKNCLDKAGLHLKDVDKILIHQANEKMDEAILERLCKLYGQSNKPEHIMPMTVSWLGNSSVATIPTLLDLLLNDKIANQNIKSGDLLVFASVGAGMNINAMVYKMP